LRVQNAIARSERESLTDPRTNLPTGRLIEDQLRQIIRKEDWALMDIRINHFESFKEVYGFVASDDVLRFTGMLIGEVLDELGSDNDFIGHIGGDNFIVITEVGKSPILSTDGAILRRSTHLATYKDRQRGYLRISGRGHGIKALMDLSLGIMPNLYHFTDIADHWLAAQARRGDWFKQ
jgi:GGDEF domain-containing protein